MFPVHIKIHTLNISSNLHTLTEDKTWICGIHTYDGTSSSFSKETNSRMSSNTDEFQFITLRDRTHFRTGILHNIYLHKSTNNSQTQRGRK